MLKSLTLFGKIAFCIGIIALILGVILFAENNVPIDEQYLSYTFIFLGFASLLAAYLSKKQ